MMTVTWWSSAVGTTLITTSIVLGLVVVWGLLLAALLRLWRADTWVGALLVGPLLYVVCTHAVVTWSLGAIAARLAADYIW